MIDLGKEYYIWLKKEKKDRQKFVYPLPQHLTKNHPFMAIIPQLSLFAWEEIEELGDLERLRLVIEYMPDEQLMRVLEKERGKGRDDYPIRAMWNALLAGIVFQHDSDAKLLRELARNGQLRSLCGFN